MRSRTGHRAAGALLVGVILFAPLGTRVQAGVLDEGVIILHAQEDAVYTMGNGYCGEDGLSSCRAADTRVDLAGIVICHAVAAFPEVPPLGLRGIVFGVEYGHAVEIIDWGACADYEWDYGNGWPESGTGTSVAWDSEMGPAQTIPFYWFAAYWDGAEPDAIALGPHPEEGGYIGSWSPLWLIHDITDYGRLGFGQGGYLPCPESPVPAHVTSWGRIKSVWGGRE